MNAPSDRGHESCTHQSSLDSGEKRKLLSRLRRIEGQVRGLQRMIEEDRYCPDILTQVSAVSESLRGSAQILLRSHLHHCVTDAVLSGESDRAETVYDELADLFRKFAR